MLARKPFVRGYIAKLYHKGRAGDFTDVQAFREEYRLNSLIHHYPKPYIGFLQGWHKGGGVGISCHGSHRIVGKTTKMAMPNALRPVPDVGGSYSDSALALLAGFWGSQVT